MADLRTQAPIYWAYRNFIGRDPTQQELAYWRESHGMHGNGEQTITNIYRAAHENRSPADQRILDGQEDVAKDNDYAAFLRKMAFDESQIQSNLEANKSQILNRMAAQAGTYDWQKYQATRRVDSDYQNRGLGAAGGRLRDRNEAQATITRQQQEAERGQYDQVQSLERDAANRIADLRRQRAEEELAARQRLTQQSVDTGGQI